MSMAINRDVKFIDQVVTWLVTYHPFYASIILKRELIGTETPPPGLPPGMSWTAAVSARGQIWYNPPWLEQFGVKGAAFIMAHECMHFMLGHCLRRGDRDPYWWNHWGDAVINEMQLASNAMYPNRTAAHFQFPMLPDGSPCGVRYPGAEKMSVEQLYAMMPNPPKPPPSGGGQGDDGDGEPDAGAPNNTPGSGDMWGQDIIECDMDEGEKSAAEAQLHVELQQAVESAKRMGKLPGGIRDLVESLLTTKTPWYEKMAQFFTSAAENDYSYQYLDRRFISTNMFLPWFSGEGLGTVVLIIDVSGSISSAEMACFSGHVNKVLSDCMPELCVVVFVHHHVADVVEYTPNDFPVDLECTESGGTDMTKGIDYACENHADADCIVVLTDGHTPFGVDCGIPTFWAITTELKAPWGETVQVEVDE